MGKTIGIISIKGGVGKTSTVSALGAALANEAGKKVLLVDGNFSAPNLGLHLGLVNPDVTLHHVLHDKKNIKDAIYETDHGFHLIPGSLVYRKVNPFKLRDKLKPLRKKYDIILIDSSPTLNEEILAAMIASDELFVVTTPDCVTLSTTLRAVRLARQKKTPISGIILNKTHDMNFELGIEDIENAAEAPVLAVLPYELEILEALSQNKPSTLHKNTKAVKEYKKLAAALAGEKYKESMGDKFRRWFKRVPKQDVNRLVLLQERK